MSTNTVKQGSGAAKQDINYELYSIQYTGFKNSIKKYKSVRKMPDWQVYTVITMIRCRVNSHLLNCQLKCIEGII